MSAKLQFLMRRFVTRAGWLALFVLALSDVAGATSLEEVSRSPSWLRIYQYEKRAFGKVRSDVASENFFFSPRGRFSPREELEAAIRIYEAGEKGPLIGTQKLLAACVFPARKKVLETLLNRRFPDVECKELKDWVGRVGADQVSAVFVGAYSGNPASILGHTFLRFSNRSRESQNREGIDLLSYSVGFMALPDKQDSRMVYMLKGLTGGYPGFYEIEPHYMKVGLYNNSESRDLWEVPLKLDAQEVNLLVMHLWELTFNARFDYFFIDENCSYRLLTMLDAVKPELNLSSRLSTVVLPAETVRALVDSGITIDHYRYRASVLRRLSMKLKALSPELRAQFTKAIRSKELVSEISDANVIDALLDHWIYENYRAEAKLASHDQEIMEATYLRAAQLKSKSSFTLSNDQIRETEKLQPPFAGHKPKWVTLHAGVANERLNLGLSYRSGVHPYWSIDRGYQDTSAIEYLGFDFDWHERGRSEWSLLLINALSTKSLSRRAVNSAWKFTTKLDSDCRICQTNRETFELAGGYGLGVSLSNIEFYLLAHSRSLAWVESGFQGTIAPGAVLGGRIRHKRYAVVFESSIHYSKNEQESDAKMRLTHQTSTQFSLFAEGQWRSYRTSNDNSRARAGFAYFFD